LSATAALAACRAAPLPPAVANRPPAVSIAAAQPSNPPITTPTAPKPNRRPPSARAVATGELAAIARRLPAGSVSVAALNTRTGAAYFWGERGGMWTGSAYKLLVLEALLLQRQGGGGWFSASELSDITDMIEASKNDAGYRMYLDAGGGSALAAAARRLGLHHTKIGIADPALTAMDARDGIALLRNLVSGRLFDKQSRAFVLDLMHNVQGDQRWGVGAVADPGTSFANKNGWMQVDNDNDPGEDDEGRWLATSLGIVRVHGEQLLMAIFTRHSPDRDTGIRLVERLARVVAPAVT
jgi:hypothetical protein